jgi:hypothetical protein
MWVIDCNETGGEHEKSPEEALKVNIGIVEEAAMLCGCQDYEDFFMGKLSNSLDLVICTFH